MTDHDTSGSLRADVESAVRKHTKPVEYLLRDVLWSGGIAPAARGAWRVLERTGPLWAAITAVATGILAWTTLRGGR